MNTLALQLDAFMDGLLERTDPTTAAVLRKAGAGAVVSEASPAPLRVGDAAPDFELPDQRGALVSLHGLLDRGPVVLTFFRGGWCPFCTISLRALDAITDEIGRQGAELVAISPQRADLTADTAERNALRFRLLTDKGGEVARQYGVRRDLNPELREIYRRFGHSLSEVNAGGEWALPVPAGFVIRPDGRISYAHTDGRITRRLEPDEALRAISTVKARQPEDVA